MQIFINRNGQQMGPFSIEQINQMLAAGSVQPTDPAWHAGMAEWGPLSGVPGVIAMGSAIPTPAMGAVCPQCNASVQPGQAMCAVCGTNIHAVPAKGKMAKGKLIALVAGGVVLVGGVAAFFLLGKKKDGDAGGANGGFSRADAIKCKNNLKTIGMAFHDFSSEIDGSTPHLYGAFFGQDGNALANALGYEDYHDAYDCKQWLNAYALRQSLNGYATLVSPLDKAAIAVMKRNPIKTFDHYRERINLVHDPKQMSYAIALQGDVKASETVLSLTRNVQEADPGMRRAYIRQWGGRNHDDYWKYPNEDRQWTGYGEPALLRGEGNGSYDSAFIGSEDATHGIVGMKKGQSHWLTASGAVASGSEAEFNDQLRLAEDNFREGDAISDGLNLIILRPTQ